MEQQINEILGNLFEGVYVVDTNRKIIFWNTGSEKITGYKAEEVINNHCYQNILRHVTEDGKELCFDGCPLHATLADGQVREANVFLHHKEGHRVPVTVKSMPIYDSDGKVVAAIEVFTDSRFSEDTIEENRALRELLSTDSLTQIPNRRYLDFYLENLIKEHEQFNTIFGVLFFDIDLFKNVNDTYGHNIGDEILKMVSKTLKRNVRGEDVIGRWGGEEFIGIIRIDTADKLMKIAEKLRLLVEKSAYSIPEGDVIKVTISIGGTIYVSGEEISKTIDRADKLMYESKQTGRNKSTVK